LPSAVHRPRIKRDKLLAKESFAKKRSALFEVQVSGINRLRYQNQSLIRHTLCGEIADWTDAACFRTQIARRKQVSKPKKSPRIYTLRTGLDVRVKLHEKQKKIQTSRNRWPGRCLFVTPLLARPPQDTDESARDGEIKSRALNCLTISSSD